MGNKTDRMQEERKTTTEMELLHHKDGVSKAEEEVNWKERANNKAEWKRDQDKAK